MYPILEDNLVMCIHGGKVNLKAKNAKRIQSNNIPIMLNNEIQGASISGCLNPPILGGPCSKVALVFPYTFTQHQVNNKRAVLQMGLIGVSDKAYPILAIPKKNTIKFSPAKIKANPLSKLEYERIQWEGIKKEEESKKKPKGQKEDRAAIIQTLQSNKQKGNYAEMEMDKYYQAQSYKRISKDEIKGLDDKIHHGIDGIYYNPKKTPPYIIAESKFGKSRLANTKKSGKQMSDKWVKNRLNKAVGKEHSEKIKRFLDSNDEAYKARKDLFHMDKEGNITIKELDKNANIKSILKEIKNAKGSQKK